MRPQRIAADYAQEAVVDRLLFAASMRPQRIAADYFDEVGEDCMTETLQGGRSELLRITALPYHPSPCFSSLQGGRSELLRITAGRSGRALRWWCSFNEAAANCCGLPRFCALATRSLEMLQGGRSELLRITDGLADLATLAAALQGGRSELLRITLGPAVAVPDLTTHALQGGRSELLRITRHAGQVVQQALGALMRPQRIAADYVEYELKQAHGRARFNEAAANCCGLPGWRPRSATAGQWLQGGRSELLRITGLFAEFSDPAAVASMRPQRIAADYQHSSMSLSCAQRRFNEAAANSYGLRVLQPWADYPLGTLH